MIVCAFLHLSGSIYQIKQREQENPNNVDEMPVQTEHLDWSVIDGPIHSLSGIPYEYQDDDHADDHMRGMQSGHSEIESEEQRCVSSIRTGRAGFGTAVEIVPRDFMPVV